VRRDAGGKLVEKTLKQVPAREEGGYQVNVQVMPKLIEHSSVSITFVTIQPEHDKLVQALIQEGKRTAYTGIWSSDGRTLPKLVIDARTIGWIEPTKP
jgi:hypothetical protein